MFPPEDVGIEVCEGCLFLSVFSINFSLFVIPVSWRWPFDQVASLNLNLNQFLLLKTI